MTRMVRCVVVASALWAGSLGFAPGQEAANVIQNRKDPARAGSAENLLRSDVVELEFRVGELKRSDQRFSRNGFNRPGFSQNIGTVASSRLNSTLDWESGIDLALFRGDAPMAGGEVSEWWRPEFRNRFTYRPVPKGELSLGTTLGMEQRREWDQPADLWRANAAYRQQLSRLTELRLEIFDEEYTIGGAGWRLDRSGVSTALSQGIGTHKVRARVGFSGVAEDHHSATAFQRHIQREEAGIDWQVVRQLSLYGGVAHEEEIRDVWAEDEELLLQEVWMHWSPEKVLAFSAGFAMDARSEQADTSSSRSRWHVRGDLNPLKEMSFFGQVRWDELGREGADGTALDRENKLTVEAGHNFQIDEATRLTAEYGVVQDQRSNAPQGTLVEHMLSVVVRTEF